MILTGHVNTADGQQVTPDGTTQTTVGINPSGRPEVGIASAGAGGVSLNRYTTFDVGREGVALDNRSASAKTIVNEVTGTGKSTLAGEIEVLGASAGVIVSNPNGIVIDGLSFKNTGVIALSTGHVSLDASGRTKLTTSQGSIDVSGAGISGLMQELDLLSKEVRLRGTISADASAGASAAVKVIAGSSEATFANGTTSPRA